MELDQAHYEQIIRVFPRPCADILILSPTGKIWLMYRANQPYKHQWWFPGGRVHFSETRLQTAVRKLSEECQLGDHLALEELGTHDLFSSVDGRDYHDIATLFRVEIEEHSVIKTDSQALDSCWFTPEQCATLNLHPYVYQYVREGDPYA